MHIIMPISQSNCYDEPTKDESAADEWNVDEMAPNETC